MRLLASATLLAAALFAAPASALADNVMCNGYGNQTFCSGYMSDTYVSYSCIDYGYEVDCTMTTPYYYHWTVSRS